MKILYSGYYGARNSGDDAFVEIASWGAKKYWECNEHLFFAQELPQVQTKVDFFSAHSSYLNFAKAVKEILFSDIFVSAGGSTFHSSLKKTDLRTYAKLKKQMGFQGKTGAIGISLGPFKNRAAEKNTIEYLKTLDFLALRDTRSYNIAESFDLPYEPVKAFDLAALLPDVYDKNSTICPSQKKKIIGISICNYERYIGGDLKKEERRNRFIMELLQRTKSSNDVIFRFFIFNGNKTIGDERITSEFIEILGQDKRLNVEIVPYLANVKEVFRKITECDVVISTRLHASIFACYAKKPFFLVEYHQKCADFLEDIGQPVSHRVFDGDCDIDTVSEKINSILDNETYDKPRFINETIDRAYLNFTATLG